jgi:hypothetical protein
VLYNGTMVRNDACCVMDYCRIHFPTALCMLQPADGTQVAHWAQPLNRSLRSSAAEGPWQTCHKAALLVAACAEALQLSCSLLSPTPISASRLSTAASQALDMACSLAPLAFTPRCGYCIVPVRLICCVCATIAPLPLEALLHALLPAVCCAWKLASGIVLCCCSVRWASSQAARHSFQV